MKWFLLEFLQFVKTSNNILGVVFGFFYKLFVETNGESTSCLFTR